MAKRGRTPLSTYQPPSPKGRLTRPNLDLLRSTCPWNYETFAQRHSENVSKSTVDNLGGDRRLGEVQPAFR